MKINHSILTLAFMAVAIFYPPNSRGQTVNSATNSNPPSLEAAAATPTQPPNFNDLLKTNTAELIGWVKNTAEKTGNFATQQTPLFISEYIRWQIWSNFISFFGLLVPAILMPIFAFKSYQKINGWENGSINRIYDRKSEKEFGFSNILFLIFGLFTIILEILLLGGGIPAFSDGVKAIVSPRVVIVEKAAELMKGK